MSDIGFVMMKKEELQNKAAAKDRPVVSVSKLKLAATGAAAVIPGGQALAGCTPGELRGEIFPHAKFGKWTVARWLDGSKTLMEISDESPYSLRLNVIEPGEWLSLEIFKKSSENKSTSVIWRSCSQPSCPFWNVTRKDGDTDAAAAAFKEIYKKYHPRLVDVPLQRSFYVPK